MHNKKRISKGNDVRNMQFMCDLKNKCNLINSELIKVTDLFNSGGSFYLVSKKKKNIKILKAYDKNLKRCNSIKLYTIGLYYQWNFNFSIEFNKKQFPVIYIRF